MELRIRCTMQVCTTVWKNTALIASGNPRSPARMAKLYLFETIEEAQQIATEWLWTYNHERPNLGIGGITPAQKLQLAG